MKKSLRLKAFSLVECIVAMAILGVTSLLICQAYSQMMLITRTNNNMTHSLADQMQDAETRNDTNTKELSPDVVPDPVRHEFNGGDTLIMYKLRKTTDPGGAEVATEEQEYYTCVQAFAVYPYVDGVKQESGSSEPGTDIRYVYFHQ